MLRVFRHRRSHIIKITCRFLVYFIIEDVWIFFLCIISSSIKRKELFLFLLLRFGIQMVLGLFVFSPLKNVIFFILVYLVLILLHECKTLILVFNRQISDEPHLCRFWIRHRGGILTINLITYRNWLILGMNTYHICHISVLQTKLLTLNRLFIRNRYIIPTQLLLLAIKLQQEFFII